MKTLLKILKFLLCAIGIGGFVCAIILAVSAKAWFPLVAILALGGLASPTIKRLVTESVE